MLKEDVKQKKAEAVEKDVDKELEEIRPEIKEAWRGEGGCEGKG